MNDKIVITGIGTVTPFENAWEKIKTGEAISRYRFEPAEIQRQSGSILKQDRFRSVNNDAKLWVAACGKALDDAGLDLKKINRNQIGICAGTGYGSLESYQSFYKSIQRNNLEPSSFSNALPNLPVAIASLAWEITGHCVALPGEFSASAEAVLYGINLLNEGICDLVIAGGWERLTETVQERYRRLNLVSPSGISQPFDRDRDGMVLAEGAGAVILEIGAHAVQRGKIPYAYIKGYGTGGHRGREAIYQSMKRAYDNSRASKLDYLLASANGSVRMDREEAMAIKALWGNTLPVTSIKGTLGEASGASGVLAVASAVLSMNDGVIPPTVNYGNPEVDCDLEIATDPVCQAIDTVLVNSIGSNSVSIILHKFISEER